MRIGIIGLGWVGTSVAISTLHRGVARELWLYDLQRELAEGEAMDLAQGSPFYPRAEVRSVDLARMRECDAVVIAAGRGGTANETRLQLLRENARIMRDIAHALRGCRGIVVVVSNPVDVLTRIVQEASGLPPARVIGTGTMLDTARLRHALGARLDLEPRSVHAQVVGEHGDSEVVLFSSAQIGGVPLRSWPGWSPTAEGEVAEGVRRAAYEIIQRKGATNHAIGLVTASLLQWTLRGERRVLTVSRVQEGAFGLRDVALSLPTVVGADGAIEVLEPTVDEGERAGLLRSAEVLAAAYASL
ncbi:MAG: L-lactate dehydrogenase [Deltaproteobacteria bacterium]|nr:MAG: L-lactate dehydrogenase [Deltaproteobacteria bacterium]